MYYLRGLLTFHNKMTFSLQDNDGSISELRQYLVEMERFDAVNLIDQALEKTGESEETATGEENNPIPMSKHALGTCVANLDTSYVH